MTPTQRHLSRLVARVGALYELSPSDIFTESRGRASQYEARRLIYLVAHVGLGLSTSQIGEVTNDSYQSVTKHITNAVAQVKLNRVFSATYRSVLKATVREFERFGLEMPGAAE
jgi:hypothetical protein